MTVIGGVPNDLRERGWVLGQITGGQWRMVNHFQGRKTAESDSPEMAFEFAYDLEWPEGSEGEGGLLAVEEMLALRWRDETWLFPAQARKDIDVALGRLVGAWGALLVYGEQGE